MAPVWMLAAILLPMLGGAGLLLLKKKQAGTAKLLALALTCATSILVWALILTGSTATFRLASFTDGLVVAYRLDGLGRFFAGILATLWPLTVLYALSYMEHEPRQIAFFSFFTMSYAASLGVAMSSNLFTLYFNYELLTLATMPLVLHPMTRAASKATRTYLFFSLGGAAFAFASMIFLIANGADGSFTLGGLLNGHPYAPEITRIFFVLGFFGFGVKAAVFPLHVWLPRAAVAPTPVTALLHAVAVVKAGAFAVIRLTWFCFGTDLLAGTWAQWVPML
ncbi:MAG: proton-conducting membrane transporter, partial [Oscillospiraceae bacterium]|nr:proton-conducting membrane transporter [Oscillospiraceae bacterium]